MHHWEAEYRMRASLVEWETRTLAQFIAATVPVGKGKTNKLAKQAQKVALLDGALDQKTAASLPGRDEYGRTPDVKLGEPEPETEDEETYMGVRYNPSMSLSRLFRMRNAPILDGEGKPIREMPR